MAHSLITNKEELMKALIECAKIGANHVLERTGLISPFVSRSEIIQQIGRSRFQKAVDDGELSVIRNEGVNSKILCSRADFEKYLLKFTQ